jgi:hypothetical protein
MPLIRIDQNSNDINDQLLNQLVQELLKFAMELHSMNQDQISIFTQNYSPASHSTAAAEVEIRAKKLEYGDNPDQRRQEHLEKYNQFFTSFLKSHNIAKGIVLTLTLEDWSVKWIPGEAAT